MYMPGLIQAGRVYSAVPPLYGVKQGKKTTYFRDKIEYTKYTQKEFCKNNNITDIKNKPLTNSQVLKIMVDNLYYTYEMSIISNRYAIDPYLLETILMNRNKTDKQLMTIIKKKFRFLNKVERHHDTLIIEGLVDGKYQNVFINQKLLDDSKNIINYIDGDLNKYYKLNNEEISLYGLMTAFENTGYGNITRFKGLGEMSPDQLFESTINPGEDSQRSLIKYTLEDVKKEIDTIAYLESDKSQIIKDMKIDREQVIG